MADMSTLNRTAKPGDTKGFQRMFLITYPRGLERQVEVAAQWGAAVGVAAPGVFKPFVQSFYVDLSEIPTRRHADTPGLARRPPFYPALSSVDVRTTRWIGAEKASFQHCCAVTGRPNK